MQKRRQQSAFFSLLHVLLLATAPWESDLVSIVSTLSPAVIAQLAGSHVSIWHGTDPCCANELDRGWQRMA